MVAFVICVVVPHSQLHLKVKGLSIYIPPLTLNDRQQFTIRSGILTGNDAGRLVVQWLLVRV